MFAKQISVQQKDKNLEELLTLVREGAEVVIMQGDKSVARITPIEEPTEVSQGPRVPGLFPGIWMSEDFDEPLPDEFWFGEDA
jgi:antitoxin (DNA-binding transcriptional repressor) of toxin-antitoxin stability system